MGDGNLVLRQRHQHLARRIYQIGEALRELGARDRLDLVEHQGDDVVEQRGLALRSADAEGAVGVAGPQIGDHGLACDRGLPFGD
jgi:hypothetical protein